MENKKLEIQSGSQLYKGSVKITLFSGKTPYKTIVQHNYGTAKFFEFIWQAVAGYDVVYKRPAYIILCNDSEGASPIVSYGILCEGTPEVDMFEDPTDASNGSCNLTFSFLIPSTVVQNKTVRSLILRSLDKSSDYAVLKLDDAVELGYNENMLISWTLTISNSSVFVSEQV